MSAETNLFKNVDTTRFGEVIYISDDIPVQTILYGVEDVFGLNYSKKELFTIFTLRKVGRLKCAKEKNRQKCYI